jgi:predicted ATPase
MIIEKPNLFAVTGGPGAGKTTLMRALQALGETCVEESARAVIQAEISRGAPRPVGRRFCEMTLARDVAAFQAAGPERTFLDRSLVDSWGAAGMDGGPSWPQGEAAVRTLRLNRRAFIAPPWKAIYVNDAERIQTWAQAIEAYDACGAAYAAAGYELVELPLTEPKHRAAFVLEASG